MYLGIVLLGLFNGLVLLPALLFKFGPRSCGEVEKGNAKSDSLLFTHVE
jgi:hypothetical protein